MFEFDTSVRLRPNRHWAVSYLKGRTTRPRVFVPTAFTSTMRTAAELLLEDSESDENIALQRRAYQEALCDAVAYNIQPHQMKDRVKDHPGLSAEELKMPVHALAAAAAVGDTDRVQNILCASPGAEEISSRSEIFGYALSNAASIGRVDIVSLLFKSFGEPTKVDDASDAMKTAASAPNSQQGAVTKALAAACEQGHQPVVQMLSQHTNQF